MDRKPTDVRETARNGRLARPPARFEQPRVRDADRIRLFVEQNVRQ